MNAELRKKLIVPCIVFLAILGINTNSIVSGVNEHNTFRIVVACLSSLIVLGLFILVVRRAIKGDKSS